MKYEILPSGNLQFSIDKDCAKRYMLEDLDMLQDIKDLYEGDDIVSLYEFLDNFGYSTNGYLWGIMPEDVGALTGAPMLSDDVEYTDDGNIVVSGNVWWYPDYAVSNWLDVLIKNGSVVFTKA